MLDREYVPGRAGMAVVSDTALTTSPFSYSQTFSTLRTAVGNASIARAGLGGVRFINLFNTMPA